MKKSVFKILSFLLIVAAFTILSCGPTDNRPTNTTALDEQAHTELNQRTLMQNQPPPSISWSLERDNLTKRTLLQNDRSVVFYMYVLLEGYGVVGYYQVNKVSSVNSQLTNPMQAVDVRGPNMSGYQYEVLPSPAEDGSYGENGNGVFGFTPEDAYIEHNCKYISSTVPLHFKDPVPMLAVITTAQALEIKSTMKRIGYKSQSH